MRKRTASSALLAAGGGCCARDEGTAAATTSAAPSVNPPTETMVFFVRCSIGSLWFGEGGAQAPGLGVLAPAVGRRSGVELLDGAERGLERAVELRVAALALEMELHQLALVVDGEAHVGRELGQLALPDGGRHRPRA